MFGLSRFRFPCSVHVRVSVTVRSLSDSRRGCYTADVVARRWEGVLLERYAVLPVAVVTANESWLNVAVARGGVHSSAK